MCRMERWSVSLLRKKIGGMLIRALRVIRDKTVLFSFPGCFHVSNRLREKN
jgi:hypothetical protein